MYNAVLYQQIADQFNTCNDTIESSTGLMRNIAMKSTVNFLLISFVFNYSQRLPKEMLELLMMKSVVGIMSVEWKMNVRDNESVSGSYNLYETVANKSWMSAYIRLKSVAYQWMSGRCPKRKMALRRCVLYYRVFIFWELYHEVSYYFRDSALNCPSSTISRG